MREASAPCPIACSTAATSDWTRASGVVAAAAGAITRQPASFATGSHCAASEGSISAIAGACANPGMAAARLIAAHPRTNLLDELFDFIRFFQRREREDVPVVLLDLLLQLLREIDQLRC